MARIRKGGFKRKAGARDKYGKPVQIDDPGTPELLAHKFAATGSTREEISALGVLHGRQIIDDDHLEAGNAFMRCYHAYIGNPNPPGASLERTSRGSDARDDAALARMKIRYWNCLAALKHVGPHVFTLVRDVCLYDRTGGLVGHIIAFDIVRVDGMLIARKAHAVPPPLRQKIGAIVRGLEVLDNIPKSDYSREATQLLATLQARDRELTTR